MQRGDDAEAHALVQSERVSDGNRRLAEHEIGGGAERGGRELPIGLDLEHRQIPRGVGADDLRDVVGSVLEAHLDARPARHDVVVRQHVAGGIEDEARSERIADLVLSPDSAEETIEGVLRRAALHHFLGVAVDDGRAGPLDGSDYRAMPGRALRSRPRSCAERRDERANDQSTSVHGTYLAGPISPSVWNSVSIRVALSARSGSAFR